MPCPVLNATTDLLNPARKAPTRRSWIGTIWTRAASCYAPGSCGSNFGPCCVSGMCQVGSPCGNLASDASAETSADAAMGDAGG
jgi:hypothetical protein